MKSRKSTKRSAGPHSVAGEGFGRGETLQPTQDTPERPGASTEARAPKGDPSPATLQRHPLARVVWVAPETLRANGYNPNRVMGPEMALLRTSILEDGWTQPIVARHDGEVIDGYHRWTLALTDAEVRAASCDLCPVVFLSPSDRPHQIMSTIRHNRARGHHGVVPMAAIVRELLSLGLEPSELLDRLGMEAEEVERLAESRGSPETASRDTFGPGWVPDASARASVKGRQPKPKGQRSKALPASGEGEP